MVMAIYTGLHFTSFPMHGTHEMAVGTSIVRADPMMMLVQVADIQMTTRTERIPRF